MSTIIRGTKPLYVRLSHLNAGSNPVYGVDYVLGLETLQDHKLMWRD